MMSNSRPLPYNQPSRMPDGCPADTQREHKQVAAECPQVSAGAKGMCSTPRGHTNGCGALLPPNKTGSGQRPVHG
eukprot:gene10726-biopygen4676